MAAKMRTSRWLITALVIVFALVLAACGGAAPAPAAPAADAPAAAEAEAPAAAVDTDAKEAPMLAEMVAAGELPALEERLPANPKVVEPAESLGQYGGTWHMGLRGGQDNALLTRTIAYEHLVRWTPDWTGIEPNVAESYEASPDATEFTFTLREGMKWSDGTPFTADDVVFWYEDILTNEAYQAAHPVPSWLLAGGEPPLVEKVDDYTFKVTFAAPNGLFIQNLATPSGDDFTRWPKHYASQFHPDYNTENLDELIAEAGATDWVNLMDLKVGGVPGTPYDARWQNSELPTLKAWRLTTAYGEGTTQVVGERNPYYFKVDPEGRQLPYIDKVVYEIGEDVQVLVLKALNGEIDMQDRHIATLDNKAVFVDNAEAGDYGFFETVPASMNTQVIALNLTHKDPVKREIYQNKDFRIGLSYAINRQEIIDTVYVSQGEPWQLAPRPTSPFYNEQLAKQYTEYDVDKANEHLDAAGYTERDADGFRLGPDGNRIAILVDVQAISQNWIDTLELIKGYWAAVGIQMDLNVMDRSLMYTRKDSNEHDATTWGGDGGLDVVLEPRWYFPYSGESLFAEAWKEWFVNPSGVGSLVPPEEPPAGPMRQMELYNQLKATGDAAEQQALMEEILQIAADEFYAIGISLPAPGYGIVKNNFKNVPASFPNAWLYPHPAPTNPEQYYIQQ
ncbi:MAG: ABC transporter substrate-binding protein [Caldilineaceae bacterium]|nr:ABC transporter substrate-binding protein [Caldilineaceae bacterium]MCB0157872.1 ABC transporter substrate-binding protein [Caldilineaceae bacterium]MCB9159305.1 ABC transporter substrate-binding protein [Caldilineaceae bacterium]